MSNDTSRTLFSIIIILRVKNEKNFKKLTDFAGTNFGCGKRVMMIMIKLDDTSKAKAKIR